jgi:DnaK suppressor protein
MTPLAPAARPATRTDLTDHLPDLRAALEQQRRFRVDQLDELDAATVTEIAPVADEPRELVARALRAGAIAALADIDTALQRIGDGSYGSCHHCNTAIPLERLEILPMVKLCMQCQRAHETGTR